MKENIELKQIKLNKLEYFVLQNYKCNLKSSSYRYYFENYLSFSRNYVLFSPVLKLYCYLL